MRSWQPRTIGPGKTLRYILPPIELWIKRTPEEMLVGTTPAASESTVNAVESEPPSSPDIEWQRFATPSRLQTLMVRPALPDRSLIIRPAAEMRIVAGHSTDLFVSIPVWWKVELAPVKGASVTLCDIPSAILSKSWFGQPTAGEPGYALKTKARHFIDEVPDEPNRALCFIRLRNKSSVNLSFERLCLRAPTLTLYATDKDILWSGDVQVTFRGEDEPTLVNHLATAPANAPEAERVASARRNASKKFTLRAFSQMRSRTGLF